MQFTLTIELGNDAMRSSADVAAALKEVQGTLLRHHSRDSGKRPATFRPYSITDRDGYTVGKWEVRDAPVRLTNAERYGRDGSRALRLDPDALEDAG